MKWPLLCAALCCSCAASFADDTGELRLIQAHPLLPAVDLWLSINEASLPKPTQFTVTIGAQPTEVVTLDSFTQTGESMAYIFLIDVSKSLNQRQFKQIQSALLQWLDGMGDGDRAALLTVGSEVKARSGFSHDIEKLRAIINELEPRDNDTHLYQGLLQAITLGRQQRTDLPVRRAIVVLSDGVDDAMNGVTMDEVLRESNEHRVPVYTIGFASPPMDDDKRLGLKTLAMLSRQSGGQFVQAMAEDVEHAYALQHRHIIDAYRLRVLCSTCIADGQLQRIHLTWADAAVNLDDSMDIRLLPAVSPGMQAPIDQPSTRSMEPIVMGALGLLLFLLALSWLYRQRLARHDNATAEWDIIESSPALKHTNAPKRTGKKMIVNLAIMTGEAQGKIHQLEVFDSLLIGRAPSCEFCITEDSEISAQHALLKLHDARLWIQDLKSTNGTWVNGVPIHNEYPLREQDLILLGRTELRVTRLE